MAGNDRQQLILRLSTDHLRSLDKAVKICGGTRQAFIHTSVMAEVAEVLERAQMKKQQKYRNYSFSGLGSSDEPREEISASSAPMGTGIAEAMRQRRDVAEPAPLQQSAAAPVVVNVGSGAGGAPSSNIDLLVTYVVNGDEFGRDTRFRSAVAILQASATSDEEQKVLAARLNEAIAVKMNKPSSTSSDGVVRVAQFAYDKLKDLWK